MPSITTESSHLFSVRSELSMKVAKEDKDNVFYCEASYFVPGETRMTETKRINITVHCEYYISVGFHMSKEQIYFQKYLRCYSFIHSSIRLLKATLNTSCVNDTLTFRDNLGSTKCAYLWTHRHRENVQRS